MGQFCAKDSVKEEYRQSTMFNSKEGTFTDTSASLWYQNLQISAFCGEILEETTDAIVTVLDPSLGLQQKNQYSPVIKLGGQLIEQEIQAWKNKNGIPKVGDIVSTHGGNLHCEFVFHSIIQVNNANTQEQDKEMIHCAILNSLIEANRLQLTSITFPILHAEGLKLNIQQISFLMCAAIKQYLDNQESNRQKCSLKLIYIIPDNVRSQMNISKAMMKTFTDGKVEFSKSLFKSGYSEDFQTISQINNMQAQQNGKIKIQNVSNMQPQLQQNKQSF